MRCSCGREETKLLLCLHSFCNKCLTGSIFEDGMSLVPEIFKVSEATLTRINCMPEVQDSESQRY